MMTMKKSAVCLAILLAMTYGASAQAEEEIALPDVTTVVSGDALTAGKDSVPDYTDVLPTTTTATVELPELAAASDDAAVPAMQLGTDTQEKSVYAEGQFGGGFPFMFSGDFSVYRESGNAPFSIDFSHHSLERYGNKQAADGYFTRETSVGVKKAFNGEVAKNTLTAGYATSDEGLQSKSDIFYDTIRHTVSASESSDFILNSGFIISVGVDGNWFRRYGGEKNTGADTTNLLPIEEDTTAFDLTPRIGFSWTNGTVSVGMRGTYLLQLSMESKDHLTQAEGSDSSASSHRGMFGVYAQYENETLTLFGDVGAVLGTAIGDVNVVVPFSVGTKVRVLTALSERKMELFAEGGLFSKQSTIRELETQYRFTYLPAIPVETSDWYGKTGVSLPIDTMMTANVAFEFRKTAFENGIWAPDYLDNSTMGVSKLYRIAGRKERTEVNTFSSFTTILGGLQLTGSWDAYWNAVPATNASHVIAAQLRYQTEDTKWNLAAGLAETLGSDADAVPNLSGSAAYRVSPSIRLALEANDVVKLLMNKPREYAGSDYVTRSGSVGFFVKFQF